MSHGIQEIIAHDNQLSASLSQVQANLWTAFYPIYQAILPAIQALGRALSWITGQLASFTAMLTGTSVKANQAGAKAMALQAQNTGRVSKALGGQSAGYNKVGKSAKKAKGELASFDKVNQKTKRDLASFDKIEVLKQNKTASPKPASSVGGGGSSAAVPNMLQGFDAQTPKLLESVAAAFERPKKPFEDIDLTNFIAQSEEAMGNFKAIWRKNRRWTLVVLRKCFNPTRKMDNTRCSAGIFEDFQCRT